MISTKNPFPGMNPFLEREWHPVHTALINFMWMQISERLPSDLIARAEQRLGIEGRHPGSAYTADLGLTEKWKEGFAPSWMPSSVVREDTVFAEPQILRVEPEVERWIEIRTPEGTVITVIELLSPSNKGPDVGCYFRKQADYLNSDTSLVEIDLLREGRFVLPVAERQLEKRTEGTCYYVCASRAWRPGTREVYCCPLRERLPAVRIPLRHTDQDLVLDLQPPIDRCYEIGRYYLGNFDDPLSPPFPPEEAAWVDERLRAAGLRG